MTIAVDWDVNQRNKQINKYLSALGPLSSHALNWFLAPLDLQETGTLHTMWLYSDRIGVCSGDLTTYTLVNVYVCLVVFTRIAGSS